MFIGLSLSEPVRNEDSKLYRQYLKLHGRRVLIHVPEFFRDSGLKFLVNGKVTSVLIPLEEGTKTSLSSIESFVTTNVPSETFKSSCLHDVMYVNVSRWCEYFQINPDGSRTVIQPGTSLGKGHYSMIVQASHVYVGPHKNGETYSLSLHVVQLTYRAADNITDLVELLSDNFGASPQPDPTKLTARKRSLRAHKGKDEIDGQKTLTVC